MSNTELKRIPIASVLVDMKLAEDIVDYKGTILIPKNTTLTNKHIFRLELYDVLSVLIYVDKDIIENDSLLDFDQSVNELIATPAFKAFSNSYKENNEVAKEHLNKISSGEPIRPKALYKLSTSISDVLANQSSLFNFLYHLHTSDDYTFSHSINVSLLCNIFGKWLNFNKEELEDLTVAGILHDIGKLKIDNSLLNKPGKLTEKEFSVIKNHTVYGYEIIQSQGLSDNIKQAVLLHHEKIDGTGYPLGLKDKRINDFAKIVCICDIYDAMTSNRSYHKKFSPFKVIQMFEEESYGKLDTHFLYVFLENIAHNYTGNLVKLSDGRTGKIVFINSQQPSKPLIECSNTKEIIDLTKEIDLVIRDIL